VLLSHLHFDHTADLMVLRYALDYARARGLRLRPLPLYSPSEPASEFRRLLYKELFEPVPISAGETLSLGAVFLNIPGDDPFLTLPGHAYRDRKRCSGLLRGYRIL